MKTRKKGEKDEDITNTQKHPHTTVLHVYPVEYNFTGKI